MFEVDLTSSAQSTYEDSPSSLQRRFDRCFALLAATPRRHANVKPLKGRLAGYWRYRVGDWRVVYRIEDARRTVIVMLIANRRDVYD